jgi:hypothetical protein
MHRLWQLHVRRHKHSHRGAQPSSRRCLNTTSLTPKRSPGVSFRRPARPYPALQRQATFGLMCRCSLLNLDTPPLGTTSTRLELGFSQESSSSSVAAFCLREDDAKPFHRADPHRRTAGAVPRARSPSGFLVRDIFTVLSIYRKKGRPWTSSAPAPTPEARPGGSSPHSVGVADHNEEALGARSNPAKSP